MQTTYLNGLPVSWEKTNFRLTDDELGVITNNEYYLPKNNHLTRTSFLLKDTRLSRVRNFLDERMKNYTENVVEIEDKFILTNSWSTITKKGEQHHVHNHPNSIFSLVFYVSSEGKKSGNLVFEFDPCRLEERWHFNFRVKKYNQFNSNTWEWEVETGDLVIFPSWMQHKTRENIADNDRIIIGANYFVNGTLGTTKNVDKIGIKVGDLEDD
mgnify:CR=1 FL=1|tara:strand:- start:96 stop:731 length:636 start_codon:yes stop_codon:yes gene_type:complete